MVHADTYGPLCDFRRVDPTGRYYIAVKPSGGPEDPGAGTPVTFAIAERKPGSPPVSEDRGRDDPIVANHGVRVRDGDLLLGQGRLKRCPRFIVISSTGLGFVGLDVRGYNYGELHSGDALVVVSRDGTVRHRKALIDLFSENEVDEFVRTAGGVAWCGGGWIDDTRKEVVVLSRREFPDMKPIPRRLRIVDMETGKVRPGSSALALTALKERNRGAIDLAIELAGEFHLAPAVRDLINLLETKPNTGNPLKTQRLAAWALGCIGPDAKAALPALTKLAEAHARDEWVKVKSQKPKERTNIHGDVMYSDDEFIDAICKIR